MANCMKLTAILLALVVKQSWSYSAGPPQGACDTMKPNHGPDGQTSAVPYELTVDSPFADGGDTVTLTLTGKNGQSFKGFMIRAFDDSSDQGVGEFNVDSSE